MSHNKTTPSTSIEKRKPTNPIARQVLEVLERGEYLPPSGTVVSLREQQAASEQGTMLYSPGMLQNMSAEGRSGQVLRVEVIDATSQVAALEATKSGPVVLLNFASARNPGGGFLGGAKAQEEDLCRCSGLYPTLLTQPEYYRVHRSDKSLLYSDHIIYSPNVPFFRVRSSDDFLEKPYFASVITAPAPNAGAMRRNQPQLEKKLPETFLRRWENILAVAQAHGHTTLILGAWGCGAFRNDPKLVARTAQEALLLPRFASSFSRVIFPIPGFNKHSLVNLQIFQSVFEEQRA